jgi:hypothetical protein
MNSTGDQWGEYTAALVAEEPGRHELTLGSQQVSQTLPASIYVQGELGERPGRPARPEVLEEISRITRGTSVSADKLQDVVTALSAIPDPPLAERRVQLWSSPWVAGLLVLLMTAFWVGRKTIGLF